MINLPAGTKIWLVAGITDMRNGFNGLAAKVQTALKDDPMSGHVFIFRGRSGSQVKLLWSTGDGLCLLTKRLERGRFAWPSTRDGERGTINIVNGTPIHERSRNIDNRRSLGHWEGDLVSGTKNSHIATLVDRKSRYTIILRLRGKDSVSVNQALTDKFLSLPSELRKSLTWDRGMELARHLEFTVSTGVKVYFCDPQSPWQRGTNENTNGLIRQYFPKKTCLAQYTQHELDLVAAQLNNRPRKTLKFKTPKEIIERGVALTD
ncbi:IS30 family transposase [Escherichia coli]|uniref:IS30 family transposase n=7 Tax=Enterobacterales TaxID=91347 RepID=UPI003CC82AF4